MDDWLIIYRVYIFITGNMKPMNNRWLSSGQWNRDSFTAGSFECVSRHL